jgi:hypothetical protein
MHVNNVVYDYAPDTAAHGPIAYVNGPSAGPYEIADVNEIVQIGTLTIPGPSTPSAIIPIRTQNLYPGSTMYLEDNVGYGMTGPHGDAQWSGVWDTGRLTSVRDFRVDSVPSWFSAFGMDVLPSSEVEGYVLANAGARPLDRDAIDARVTDDCRRRAGHLIDGQGEVGGLPTLTEHRRALSVPADPHTVVDAAGRTRIEAWLEGLAQDLEPPRP